MHVGAFHVDDKLRLVICLLRNRSWFEDHNAAASCHLLCAGRFREVHVIAGIPGIAAVALLR